MHVISNFNYQNGVIDLRTSPKNPGADKSDIACSAAGFSQA